MSIHTHTRSKHKQAYIKCLKEHEWHQQNTDQMRSGIWKPWFILSYSTILFEFQNFYGVEGNAKTLSHGMARTPGFGKWCPDLLQYTACALVSDTKATHKNTSQDSGQPNPDEIWTQNIQNTPPGLYTHIWEVAPGRLLIIWWRSQYPQPQHTWWSKKYLQYCFISIWMISPMF